MRNFTWIINWFRLSCRPFPVAIALALGLTPAGQLRGDEDDQAPAPVLRVARPYPELKVPPTSAVTKPASGETRTTKSPNSSRRITTAPQTAQPQATTAAPTNSATNPPALTNQAINDGWVAREMIGKRSPLTDPTLKQQAAPQQAPSQQIQSPKPTVKDNTTKVSPSPTTIPLQQPNPNPNEQIDRALTTPSSPPASPPSNTRSSRRIDRDNVPPSLKIQGDEMEDAITGQPTQPVESANSAAAPSTRLGWQATDAGPIIDRQIIQEVQPDTGSAEIAKPITRRQVATGWTSSKKSDDTSTDDSVIGSINRPAIEPNASDSLTTNPNIDERQVPTTTVEDTELSPELQRMLNELEGMKPVARMKPVENEPQAPSIDKPETSVSDNSIETLKAEPTTPLAEPETSSTQSSSTQSKGNGFARPELSPPRSNAISLPSTDRLPVAVEMQPEIEESFPAEPTNVEPSLPLKSEPRTMDIPVRRPSIDVSDSTPKENRSSEVSSSEVRSSEVRSSEVRSSEVRSGRSASDIRKPSDQSENLQDRIEKFERGESSATGRSDIESNLDSIDSAAEPLQTELRPKTAQAMPKRPAPVISAASQRLDQPIRQCLMYYHQRPEKAAIRTPWGMLHAILPFGLDANVDANRRYNAIAYLAGNNPNRNLRMLSVTRGGRLVARSGVGLQGHQAQMLAIFAQVGVPAEYPLYVSGRKFIMNDLVKTEMLACKAGEELTFTLIGLSHYLPTDSKWRAADGQMWDFERLLSEEMSQPVVGAACGGTHRLMGLSYALQQRRLEGLPMTGQWARAATYLKDFESYAWQLQNRDGSFSTEWFEGRADNGDRDRKIQTTGHILEWLLFVAEDESLQDERITRSVTFLTNNLLNDRNHEWQVGHKGHALRALSVYHRRVFNSDRPWLPESGQTARKPANQSGVSR